MADDRSCLAANDRERLRALIERLDLVLADKVERGEPRAQSTAAR